MSPAVTLVSAGVMLRGELTGDIDPTDTGASGLFVSDVRVLSRLELTVNGHACAVASQNSAVNRRSLVLTPVLPRHETSDVIVSRRQTIDAWGLADALDVCNVTTMPVTAVVVIEVASDFADPFMLRSDRRTFDRSSASRWARVDRSTGSAGVSFGYERTLSGRSFAAEVTIAASGNPSIRLIEDEGGARAARISWVVELAAGERAPISISVRSGAARDVVGLHPTSIPIATPQLAELRRQSIADISALRMPCPSGPGTSTDLSNLTVIGAGAPWFLTLFGRDSLLTSLLAEADLPGLADDNLLALMATQADATDPRRIAQPGKILHELRVSELAWLDEVPYGNYYGSVDSTPLFLSALATVGSIEIQRAGEKAARAAVEWMHGSGGLDETGFLRYISDPNGLITQGWKDSADSVAHADGRIAAGAIALCEVQGYAWRALMDTARLARDVWDDGAWASELESVADELRDRFRDRFWIPGHDYPALAIDGADERVEVVASNAGHLMFSQMLSDEEAARVATRLMDADMFTGWGIRTLSSSETRFNPLSYHNGSVWPHDTMLAAVGMAAYGMHGEARLLAAAMVDAAAYFDNRPAELFAGFDRARFPQPVTYAHAAAPQAWASAAMLAAARLLGKAATEQKEGV